MVHKKDLQGRSGHVVPSRVDLPQLREWNFEVCAVPWCVCVHVGVRKY